MNEILAKSKKEDKKEINLAAHNLEILNQLDILKKMLMENIEDESKPNNMKDVFKLLEYAILYHDLGKVSPAFQGDTLHNWDYKPCKIFPNIPHSLFSLFWIKEAAFSDLSPEDKKILLSTIAFHHWRDGFEYMIMGCDYKLIEAAEILLKDKKLVKDLEKNLKDQFDKHKRLEPFRKHIGFNRDFAENAVECLDLFQYVTPPYLEIFLAKRLDDNLTLKDKKKFILTSGFLMRLDHFASYKQEDDIKDNVEKKTQEYKVETEPPKYKKVRDKIEAEIEKKAGANFDFWQEESVKEYKNKSLIFVAPTGSGKTEFASLWSAGGKIFVTLPLKTAVNSAFNRFTTYFGADNAGLLHSDADIYLDSDRKDKKKDDTETIKTLDLSRQLALPVLVATGDQFFPSALKYPGYEKIYATLAYSKLIIDEAQAYDPKAAAIIVKLIEDITNLGGQFLLMTATLPGFIKDEIIKRTELKKSNIDETQYNNLDDDFCKHNLQLIHRDIKDAKEQIIEAVQKDKGKRVLVIANTVKKAQEIYEDIKEEIEKEKKDNIKLKLLHSRFTANHRKKIEKEILLKDSQDSFTNPKPENENIPKILVSTQIVEASLDIDADYLFTELAPMDSLIQRMGRALRRVKNKEDLKKLEIKESNIKIFYQFNKTDKGKISFESGGGGVYGNELLFLTILNFKLKEERDKILDEFNKAYQEKKEQDKRKKLNKFIEDGLKVEGQKGKYFQVDNFLPIKEIDKKKLVEDTYKALDENSSYMSAFYNMLALLDAGYVSDRKSDAQKEFREILTIPVVLKKDTDKLKEKVKSFCKNEPITWLNFKKEIISEFVINISSWTPRKEMDKKSIFNEIKDKDKLKKLYRWFGDIYILESGAGTYNKETGLKINKDYKKNNDGII